MAESPTQRTVKLLKAEGYTVAIVEHWNPFAHKKQDLYGFLDIVAIRSDIPGVLGVQTTSGSNASARAKKIHLNPIHKIWLDAGNRIEVHGWAKRGPKGKRKVWTCKRQELTSSTVAPITGTWR